VRYVWGSAEKIPSGDNAFTKVLSVESFYYYADQGKALDEVRRAMAPGGRLFILINLYRDNHYSLRWVTELKVPVQVHSEAEYIAMLQQHGFTAAEARRIPTAAPLLRRIQASGSKTRRSCGISNGSGAAADRDET